jgi:aspartate-semialdehyde dehydrogenase/adenine nucleotide transporter 17
MSKLSPLSDSEKVFVEALAGAFGGLAGAVAFYPLDTIKTRIQAAVDVEGQRRKTWTEVFNDLVENEGPWALFAGVGAKGAHSMASSFLYFLAFSSLRRRVEAHSGKKIGVAANLAIAMLAGCCNVLVTEPLDTLSTRRQICGADDDGETSGSSSRMSFFGGGAKQHGAGENGKGAVLAPPETFADLVASAVDRVALAASEWGRLYSGVGASLLLTVNPAIQHTCFEQARRRVIGGLRRRAARRNGGVVSGAKKIAELSVSDAFVLGAASKAVATFITYPLVRAKVLAKAPERRDVSRKRRDASRKGAPPPAERFRGKSLPAVMRGVVETEGAAGLYKGLQAQLLKTVLVAAFSLTVKEKSFRTAMLVVLLMNRL